MVKFGEIDKNVTFKKQMEEDTGPFVLINSYSVDPKEVDEFLKAFAAVSEAFKRLPGFISAQLHRGIGGSGTFVNYSVWESMAEFRKTFADDEGQFDKVSTKYCRISTPLHEGRSPRNLCGLTV